MVSALLGRGRRGGGGRAAPTTAGPRNKSSSRRLQWKRGGCVLLQSSEKSTGKGATAAATATATATATAQPPTAAAAAAASAPPHTHARRRNARCNLLNPFQGVGVLLARAWGGAAAARVHQPQRGRNSHPPRSTPPPHAAPRPAPARPPIRPRPCRGPARHIRGKPQQRRESHAACAPLQLRYARLQLLQPRHAVGKLALF